MLEVRVWAHETEGALGTAGDSCEVWGAREPHPGPENTQKKPAPLAHGASGEYRLFYCFLQH